MFTGIVSAVGRVARVTRGMGNGDRGMVLTIRAPYKGLKRGESVAVNGACLTVERVVEGGFTVHAVDTTLGRTLIGEWTAGRPVNLERAVRAADRLGGHLVLGHVDAVATVAAVAEQGDALLVDLRVPSEVRELCIPHGSITVDGVSLTVNALPGGGVVQVSLIPFTRARTTLEGLRPGERVHVEGDVLGKYVRQLCRTDR
ncbi:MAG: riboflavin synthase subunit alpha [Gemmatimonadetes bacterium 13_1_40CM_70_11]|nr:MAG: riboflavin synthase subunit alpha [Gemmatimonadetes bacterium 13_1_40CM_70_11]